MAGNLELVKTTTSSSNADIVSITDCFTSEYDIYKVIYVSLYYDLYFSFI